MRSSSTLWRTNFIESLHLLAQAAARLPLGMPEPILCGASVIELYTGGLWPGPGIELLASDTRQLAATLFAVGNVPVAAIEACGTPDFGSVSMSLDAVRRWRQ
jgi:hypothetical protein